jgi:hypothetical protein
MITGIDSNDPSFTGPAFEHFRRTGVPQAVNRDCVRQPGPIAVEHE